VATVTLTRFLRYSNSPRLVREKRITRSGEFKWVELQPKLREPMEMQHFRFIKGIVG
jgi:hypothetical protein